MDENEWIGFNEFTMRVSGSVTPGALRQIIFYKDKNGASHFIRRIGAKIYLSIKKYDEWIDKEGKV